MTKRSLLVFGMILTFGSCQVGPRYNPPAPYAPLEWKNEDPVDSTEPPAPCPVVCNWWDVFQDEKLNELEWLAFQNNPNLYVALARIDEAWSVAGINKADLYPQVNLNPSFADTGELFKLYLPSAAKQSPIFSTIGSFLTTPFRIVQFQYVFPLNMSYEIDLWGKYRSLYKSAFLSAQAQQEAYDVALLSLTSDVASSYFQLRTFDSLVQIYKDTIDVRQQIYDLAKNRFDKGLVTYADVASAELQVANADSDYQDALRQRGLQENILAVLIGVPPSDFCLEPIPLTGEPPAIPAGIPSTVLQRRPDIAQAERTMAAQNQQVRASYADMFPSFTMTGTLGFLSPTFEDFFKWISRLWAIGANSSETVFDGGRKQSAYMANWARFAEASGDYQYKVLTAFREVEDALNDLEYEKKQVDSLQISVGSATKLVSLSDSRYTKGLANYIEVSTNQTSQLTAQRSLVLVQGTRYQSTIQLIKALGGSWNCPCE